MAESSLSRVVSLQTFQGGLDSDQNTPLLQGAAASADSRDCLSQDSRLQSRVTQRQERESSRLRQALFGSKVMCDDC